MKTQRYKVHWRRYSRRIITPEMEEVDGRGYWMQWKRTYPVRGIMEVDEYLVIDSSWPKGLSCHVRGSDVVMVQEDNTRHHLKCKRCGVAKAVNRYSERSRVCRPCLAKERSGV